MRVLITGATGFIGTNLSLHYSKLGHQVVGLSKEATDAERENAADLEHAGVELLKGSVTDDALLRQAIQGVDLVFHIAAAMREANIPDKVFWDVNVDATRRLLEISKDEGVSRFVYCSSIGAMGWSMQKPSTEESPCRPEDIYQVTKQAAEQLCLEFYETNQLPVVILRPADVYGPRDRRLLKLFRGIKKGRFVMIGSGKNEHHMVHVNDLVAAFSLAAVVEAAVGQIFIIAEDCPVQINQLVEVIAEQTGGSVPRFNLPLRPVQAAAVVMEGVCKPLGIQPPLYPRRVDFFRTDYSFDISKAKQVLGFQPQYDLKRGVRETLEWYEQRGLILKMRRFEMDNIVVTERVTRADNQQNISAVAAGTRDISQQQLSAKLESFDSFWEGPDDVEKGYHTFGQFYRVNYLPHMPSDKLVKVLVVSCGPGYFLNLLRSEGYSDVLGIDSASEKVGYALEKKLNARVEDAFSFLQNSSEPYDVIFCEQELNHLTKDEMVIFLKLCWSRMKDGGTLIVHGLNGANPLTGAEALAQNFDHFSTFTDYSLKQVLHYSGFGDIRIIPLDLYVFYNNPMNYVGKAITGLLSVIFRAGFMLYGKSNKIFTKKIGASCIKLPGGYRPGIGDHG